MPNEIWKYNKGLLCGYTEDRELIRRIKRYKKDWTIMADYFKGNRLIGVQFIIPIEQRRSAERMFNVANTEGNQAI